MKITIRKAHKAEIEEEKASERPFTIKIARQDTQPELPVQKAAENEINETERLLRELSGKDI